MEHSRPYFGAVYADDSLSGSRTEADLDMMREAGLNVIRFGADGWAKWEPQEGLFDFTSLHRVLSGAQSRNIQVILSVLTGEQPHWLENKPLEQAAKYTQRFLRRLLEQCEPYSCVVGFALPDSKVGKEIADLLRGFRDGQCFLTGQQTEYLDFPGCQIFHSSGMANSGMEISAAADRVRGRKNGNHLVLKTQSQGAAGELPYPGQLRLAAYHHLAGGAEGVIYDQWHSDYTGSGRKGILSHDLSRGRIFRECCSIGQELNRLGDHLTGIRKQNRVAILVSDKSKELSVWPEGAERGYSDYVRWVYDSFYRLNIEVDIIPDTCRDFTGYELLVVPCLYCAEENLIWAIRDFVACGGYLIATFRSFFADENGKIRQDVQPYGMTDVFGMSYEEYTVPQKVFLPEYAAEAGDWMELLMPRGAASIAEYACSGWGGITAATCSRFGRGGAAYIGCYSPEGLEPILLRLLTTWHIPVPEISWPVVLKRGVNRYGRPLVYVLHYSDSTRVIPSPAAGTELISGVRLEEGAPLELKPWDVKILEGNK